ncbi:MAG: hypothetical protein A4C66_04155 [Nitrospira sp. HN-bin3]|uniref:hypothetical protein n=1 Tax=Nitrospira cf. moscoviensis SBR1015 TaxID=96242 RepID=UPI000A0E6544|nr:hypothetical protein [Nitrospira cf. moscoviensis SBR1015]OQW33325.1 MAG: hypothetical protein A4C66_04155 [Nitrospira sp. HN-bin3]
MTEHDAMVKLIDHLRARTRVYRNALAALREAKTRLEAENAALRAERDKYRRQIMIAIDAALNAIDSDAMSESDATIRAAIDAERKEEA